MSPVKPDDAKALIPDPSGDVCANFTKALLQLPVLFWKVVDYLFDSTGLWKVAVRKEISFIRPGDLIFSAAPLDNDNGNRLLCDGSVVGQDDYPDLYDAISTTYNTGGEGAGNFRLPDYGNRFPIGVGSENGLGVTGGLKQVTLSTDEIPSHVHNIANASSTQMGDGALAGTVFDGSGGIGVTKNTASTGGGSAHENRPPYIACYVYIKT